MLVAKDPPGQVVYSAKKGAARDTAFGAERHICGFATPIGIGTTCGDGRAAPKWLGACLPDDHPPKFHLDTGRGVGLSGVIAPGSEVEEPSVVGIKRPHWKPLCERPSRLQYSEKDLSEKNGSVNSGGRC